MMCFDEEGKRKRISRRRAMRADKHFETLERYTDLCGLEVPEDSILLLECMSNLVANEMFDESGAKEGTVEAVVEGLHHLRKKARHLVVVTNEIFSDGLEYDPETKKYQAYLGAVNCRMAEEADGFYEVVYGLPLVRKGRVYGYESDSQLFYRIFHVFQDPHAPYGLDEGEHALCHVLFSGYRRGHRGACFIFGSILPGTAPEAFSGPLWRF